MTEPETSFHSIPPDWFPFLIRMWERGADRRGKPTWEQLIEEPGIVKIPGLGDGTWLAVVFPNGEIMIEAPPGESEEDF